MKKTKDTPFYVQNFQFNITMIFWHLLLALLVLPYLALLIDLAGWAKGQELSKKNTFATHGAIFQCRRNWDATFADLEKSVVDMMEIRASGGGGSQQVAMRAAVARTPFLERLQTSGGSGGNDSEEGLAAWNKAQSASGKTAVLLKSNPFSARTILASPAEMEENVALSLPYAAADKLSEDARSKQKAALDAVKGRY